MKDQNKDEQEDKTETQKGQPNVQDKPDDKRVPTVTPANDSGEGGPATDKSAK